jgi:transcriptional regulator with XRE-family HTH domain
MQLIGQLFSYMDINIFRYRLESFRNQLGMKQKDLADKLGISTSYFNAWEKGRDNKLPRLDQLLKLCEILKKTPNDFLLEEPEKAWTVHSNVGEKSYTSSMLNDIRRQLVSEKQLVDSQKETIEAQKETIASLHDQIKNTKDVAQLLQEVVKQQTKKVEQLEAALHGMKKS